MKLTELVEMFQKLKGSEQIEFAAKNPHDVCRIVWYLEGALRAYREGG